ncbi:MAG: ABC transporter permease, partial [Candidatus Helarchaeota archaeon]|nr:ABC transporter permease [Candidatus Helarchaeota archaeon]
MKFEISVAKRYLGIKKTGNLISIIGIFLGVSCLIITLSILNGFGDLVKDMFLDFDSHIRVTTNSTAGMEDWKEIENKIR